MKKKKIDVSPSVEFSLSSECDTFTIKHVLRVYARIRQTKTAQITTIFTTNLYQY